MDNSGLIREIIEMKALLWEIAFIQIPKDKRELFEAEVNLRKCLLLQDFLYANVEILTNSSDMLAKLKLEEDDLRDIVNSLKKR